VSAMRIAIVVSCALLATVAVAGCGSSGGSVPAESANELSSPSYEKAGPNPSTSAKMVCQKEAREDIAANVGVKETRVTTPKWVRASHTYSCTYIYPRGKITLFVKEMSSEAETTAYFDGVKQRTGVARELFDLGQGAWILKNNDVVVRKDYKVLLVDVRDIPANFAPQRTRADVAFNIGFAIMGCWTGS
jgi:hypothetical protein